MSGRDGRIEWAEDSGWGWQTEWQADRLGSQKKIKIGSKRWGCFKDSHLSLSVPLSRSAPIPYLPLHLGFLSNCWTTTQSAPCSHGHVCKAWKDKDTTVMLWTEAQIVFFSLAICMTCVCVYVWVYVCVSVFVCVWGGVPGIAGTPWPGCSGSCPWGVPSVHSLLWSDSTARLAGPPVLDSWKKVNQKHSLKEDFTDLALHFH